MAESQPQYLTHLTVLNLKDKSLLSRLIEFSKGHLQPILLAMVFSALPFHLP